MKTLNIFVIVLSLVCMVSLLPEQVGATVQFGVENPQYDIGSDVGCVCSGDVDGDGYVDLIVAAPESAAVSIMLNAGDGTFGSPVLYSVGAASGPIVAIDLDDDGDIDIAMACSGTDNVSVLLNSGAGYFGPATLYDVGDYPRSIVATDLDRDHNIDLAVCNWYSDDISILSGNGDGTFDSAVTIGTVVEPYCLDVADIDDDNNQDLITAGYTEEYTGKPCFSVIFGDGHGAFDSTLNYITYIKVYGLAAEDFDADGDCDVALLLNSREHVATWSNDGHGELSEYSVCPVGRDPQALIAADYDGDGDIDIATLNDGPANISITSNNGEGLFTCLASYRITERPKYMCFGDFDNDTYLDIASSSLGLYYVDYVEIIFNRGDGYLVGTPSYKIPRGSHSEANTRVIAVDVDADGDKDLLSSDRISNSASVLLNNGLGTFDPAVSYPVGELPEYIFAGDLDGDGFCEIVTASDSISIIYNNGDSTFSESTALGSPSVARVVEGCDLDLDGDIDLIALSSAGRCLYVFYNDGQGEFGPVHTFPIEGSEPYALALADLNGDGYDDVATANYGNNTVLLNDGSGALSPGGVYPTPGISFWIATCDLDSDGDLDLLTAPVYDDCISIQYNSGFGAFDSTVNLSAVNQVLSVVGADVNGDEFNDLVFVTSSYNYELTVLLSDGIGGYSDTAIFRTGAAPLSIAASDVDGDGDIDIAVSSYFFDEITVMINNSDIMTDVGDMDEDLLPDLFVLAQNYPNPFNPTTTIEYDLPKQAHVSIDVFNVLGQQVRSLVDTDQPAGSYRIEWDGVNDAGGSVATGVYFYRLTAGEQTLSQKMVLVR